MEVLITHLLLIGYLQDSYHATAFSVNVYVIPSPTAVRLTRLEREEIETGKGARVECTFVVPQGKEKKASGKGASKVGGKTAAKRKEREEGDEDGQTGENGGKKLGAKKHFAGSGERKLGAAKKAKTQTHPENEEREEKEYEYFSDVYDGLYSDVDLDRETDQHHGDDDRDEDGYGHGMEEDDERGDDWDEMIGENWRDEGGWKVLNPGSGVGSGTGSRRARK